MIRTYEATVDERGNIRVLAPVQLVQGHRVLVTILDEPALVTPNMALLSQDVLKDRDRPEDESAWLTLSSQQLGAAYGESEPDYPITAIKEPNPKYDGG